MIVFRYMLVIINKISGTSQMEEVSYHIQFVSFLHPAKDFVIVIVRVDGAAKVLVVVLWSVAINAVHPRGTSLIRDLVGQWSVHHQRIEHGRCGGLSSS